VAIRNLIDRLLAWPSLRVLRANEHVVLDRREREHPARGSQRGGDLHPDLEAVSDRLRVLVVGSA